MELQDGSLSSVETGSSGGSDGGSNNNSGSGGNGNGGNSGSGAGVALVPTVHDAAQTTARHFGTVASQAKNQNGFVINVLHGKKTIVIRIMGAGSGGRNLPYFRVSISGLSSLTLEGALSNDPLLTHIDLNSDFLRQIIHMIDTFMNNR